jgi:Cytidylate kinase-like family
MKQLLLIDREFGAGGSAVGEALAARLGWKVFDEALSQQIARLAKIPLQVCKRREERTDPLLQRLVNLIWRGSLVPHLPSPDLAVLDTDRLVSLVQRVVEDAAKECPCVIVGRGAPYFLRDRPNRFSIFLYASRDIKFRRVFKRVGDRKEAARLVDTMDEDRRRFVKHYFGHEWPDRQLFHAMLDTGIGDEITVETILYHLNAVNRAEELHKP